MYLKFVLKETLSVLKSFVLSIFYLAVEKRGGYQRNRYVLMWRVSEKMWQSVTMGGGGDGKIAVFCVTYFLNDPIEGHPLFCWFYCWRLTYLPIWSIIVNVNFEHVMAYY